jgi:gamma-D-glutamyl-L-lysine dipeptidyl-peptidase
MRTSTIAFLEILICLSVASAQDINRMPNTLITEAKRRLAPDHRTAVFDVHGDLNGSVLSLRGEIQDQAMKDSLLHYLRSNSTYTLVDSLVALPSPSLEGKTYAVVSTSVINMRTKPDDAAELGSQAILGTPLRVLKRNEDGWYLVQTPDQYLGWTWDIISRMTEEEFDQWTSQPKVIVTGLYGTVYESPEPKSRPISDVVAGSLFIVMGEDSKYYSVVYPDGRTGWLERANSQPYFDWLAKVKDTPENIISTAYRFTGIPYLWGGTSAKALDCSGFVKTVFFLNGVLLPRDASQQAEVGIEIPISPALEQVKEGDLLFFGERGSAGHRDKVTHVAISLGGGHYINESPDVRVGSVDSTDADFSNKRAATLLKVRRVIGAGEETGVHKLRSLPYYGSHAK